MKRLLLFACLLALAAAAALTGALSSAQGSTAQSRIGGVVPVRGAKVPALGIPLVYHGGPVMVTNKTYAIYWKPAGYSMAPGYDTTINQYFTDVAHDSGLGSNVYASDTQYYVGTSHDHLQLDLRRLVHRHERRSRPAAARSTAGSRCASPTRSSRPRSTT